MGRTFVLGDVHGAYRALVQVFERSGFNRRKDRLICLGDVADRNPEVAECFTELLKVKDLVYILGNHDWWLLEWFREQKTESMWLYQGGKYSIASYQKHSIRKQNSLIRKHRALLENAAYYYVDPQNRVFVHGGFDPARSILDQVPAAGSDAIYIWDRKLFETADICSLRSPARKFGGYCEIFVGHTSTMVTDAECKPLKLCNLRALDQGAGWGGKLTLMDADTHEYWQSDWITMLYPEMVY
jgi:serine/threonine protein phosphatase 1